MNEPHIGNIVLVTAELGTKILLLHKSPWNERDELRKAEGRRRRVGIGRWGMPGGGVEATDANVLYSAYRETREETGLEFPLDAFRKVGVLEGFRQRESLEPEWIVHIYRIAAWPGMHDNVRCDPKEHDDIRWFSIKDIPYDDMIESDKDWLPVMLGNGLKGLSVRVIFDGDSEKVLSCHMDEADFR